MLKRGIGATGSAFGWQPQGHGFESHMLQKYYTSKNNRTRLSGTDKSVMLSEPHFFAYILFFRSVGCSGFLEERNHIFGSKVLGHGQRCIATL